MMRRFRQFPTIGPDAGLPYDAEIEWLKSDGSAFINTGISYNQTTDSVEFKIDVITAPAWNKNSIWGAYESSSQNIYCQMHTAGGYIQFFHCNSQRAINATGTKTVKIGAKNLYIDGVYSWSYTGDYTSSKNLRIFDRGDGRIAGGCPFFFYKHTRNGVLVLDLVPVRVGTVGYMYDRVSGELFGNDGTGEFTLGPDVT